MTDMTDEEFDKRLEDIKRKHPGHDQDMASFFAESVERGWTQERIAKHVNLSRPYITRLLIFGEFLRYIVPVGTMSRSLTEGRFRECWNTTDTNRAKRDRFREICGMLGIKTPPPAETVEAPPKPAPVVEAPPRKRDNSETVVRQLAAEFGITKQERISDLRAIVTKGHENIITMLRERKISPSAAALYVRKADKSEQAVATVADVQHYRAEVAKAYRAAKHTPEQKEREIRRAKRIELKEKIQAASRAAIERARERPEVTREEVNYPPPQLEDQQYPDAGPGRTYATIHREIYGPVWFDVKRRRAQVVSLLVGAAHQFARNLETERRLILEEEDFEKILSEWRKALKPLFPKDEFEPMFAVWRRAFKPQYATYFRACDEARQRHKSGAA